MEHLFNANDPIVREIYEVLITELKTFGPIIKEPKKTSIHLKSRAGFAGIHPRKKYLILNIVSHAPLQSPRVIKQERVSKSRFHNEVKLEKPQDIDTELLKWLKEAYDLMR